VPAAGRVPTGSASQTGSPTAASPQPTSVQQEVEAAVRNYYAELTRAAGTLDTRQLRRMALTSCSCLGSARAIERVAAKRHRYSAAVWSVRSVRVEEVVGSAALVTVRYVVSAFAVLDRNSRVIERFPRRRATHSLSLVLVEDRWLMGSVVALENR
jgi:hypothetical protein